MSKAADLALDVLETLGRRGAPSRLTDVADELKQAKATVFRALDTLEHRGYVAQVSDGRYRLGVRCLELGAYAIEAIGLEDVARPELEKLNEATRENVHLGLYAQGDVVYIDVVESSQPVAPKSRVGTRAPATAVATGRALLAFQRPTEVNRVLAQPLQQYTPASITDPAALRGILDEIQAGAPAVNHGSWRDGVCGVAAPIRDYSSVVVASIGCCLPESRFTPERQEQLAEFVAVAADRISKRLGHRGIPVRNRDDDQTSDNTNPPLALDGSESVPARGEL